MITNPDILFLDEPTTGLDSFQAQSIMQCLKKLSGENRIIMSVIHQPRSSIYALFDKLLLLSEGMVIYFGSAYQAIDHFNRIGYFCPLHFNPSDFFLDLLSLDTRSEEREQETRQII